MSTFIKNFQMTSLRKVASSFVFTDTHIRNSSASDIFWYLGTDLPFFGASFDSGRHNLVNIP